MNARMNEIATVLVQKGKQIDRVTNAYRGAHAGTNDPQVQASLIERHKNALARITSRHHARLGWA